MAVIRAYSPGELGAVIGRNTIGILSVLLLAGALSACNQEEQGRILQYEKGTYLGPSDQTLSAEQLRELEIRTNLQSWN